MRARKYMYKVMSALTRTSMYKVVVDIIRETESL